MSDLLLALFGLVFFSPLAFIYGRVVAGRIHVRAAARGRRPAAVGLSYLWMPALVAACVAVRLSDPYEIVLALGALASNPVLSALLSVMEFVGSVALILFFLTIPFVLGRIFAVGAAAFGFFAQARQNPLRFGIARGEDGGKPVAAERAESDLQKTLVIAIDGPAAAGKGTLAKRLAERYGLPYLDTGLLYRAVGRKAFDDGVDLNDPQATGEVARRLTPSALDDGTLRGREAGELASRVAVHSTVRSALTRFQREFAGGPRGAVLDGRDIGTVICPEARVKIFVTASPEVRARRRTDELAAKGRSPEYERILAEVRERDARDSGRADAPLKAAADAHLLDTSELDIDQAFQAACDLIDRVLARPERS